MMPNSTSDKLIYLLLGDPERMIESCIYRAKYKLECWQESRQIIFS